MCRSTRAAATILPIRHGSRLPLRSARKVIFSSEFPRSPIARNPLWTLFRCFCIVVNLPCSGF